MIVSKKRSENTKLCRNNHENRNVRSNQKLCRICKAPLINDSGNGVEVGVSEENDDIEMKIDYVKVTEKRDKSVLFPHVRNISNYNTPVYESEGCIFINPNRFDRLVKVFEDIQQKTGTYQKYTSSITFSDDGDISVNTYEIQNVRQYVLVTVDGLPHKMAIDVIKHCYDCKDCGEKFSCIEDVNKHAESQAHVTYYKRFSNFILKIGGLHLQMNMLRSFVSLNWNIDYSFLAEAIGFKSPKAQLFQLKVQDLHKCMDTFNSRRTAKLREYARKFVQYCRGAQIPGNSKNFDYWLNNIVKSKNFKIQVEIDKYYGTALWMCYAAQRANYWKLYKASVRIFSGLFHSNGNNNYSVIEVYDDYLMRCMLRNNPILHEHLITRLFSNLTDEPFCAQSHDARHEEINKKGQNMFPGNSLEELDLAFKIVDDVWKLRKLKYAEMGISENKHTNIVIPDLENIVLTMRTAIRESEVLEYPLFSDAPLSYTDVPLNPELGDVFNYCENRRKNDILNVIRFNSFDAAFDSKRKKLGILRSEKNNLLSATEISNQILTLIYAIDDPELKSGVKEAFNCLDKSVKNLDFFLNALIEKEYFNLFD